MKEIKPGASCPHKKGRVQGTLECANCMYNHVEYPQAYASAARQEIKTTGSKCAANEYRNNKPKLK